MSLHEDTGLRRIPLTPFPPRGPALVYVSDDDPPTVTRLDHADDQVFEWLARRDLAFIDALIGEYQARLAIFREDIGK